MKQIANSSVPGLTDRHENDQFLANHVSNRENIDQKMGHFPLGSFLNAHHSASHFGQDDDIIHFLDEESDQGDQQKNASAWKILIADDDHNVHETTILALNGVKIHDRPLEFSHAYSGEDARRVIQDNPDIALILLDVVMETVDAGLKLVDVIRNEMGRHDLRIILRTGQPGYAPEQQVTNDFAIDGYTTKSKLTRSILISVLNDTLGGKKNGDGALPN
jgi:CheY-like chemotaxis protein